MQDPDPVVTYCEALFNGRSLFTSPIVQREYTVPPEVKPILANWCWAILNIQQISETAYASNTIKSTLAFETLDRYDATIQLLTTNEIFNDCNEQQIINTIQNLCSRLGITEQLTVYARSLLKTGSIAVLHGESSINS